MITHPKKNTRAANVKKIADPKGRLRPISFAALPEEIQRWTRTAKAIDRSFAWWVRNRLLEFEKLEQEIAARATEQDDRMPGADSTLSLQEKRQ
jgi:hypothetical protein